MVVRRFAQEYDGPDRDWGAAALAIVVECHVDAVRPSQDDVRAQWRASVVYVGPDAQQRGTREQLGPATEAAAGEVLAQDAVAVLMKGEGQRGLAVSRWRGEDDRSLADFNRGSVQREVSAVHEAECGGDSPQALLAHHVVITVRDLDASAFGVDMIRSGVRHAEREPATYLVQRPLHRVVSPCQHPVGEWCGLRWLPRLRGRHDLERLRPSARPEEPQGLLAANAEAERRRR